MQHNMKNVLVLDKMFINGSFKQIIEWCTDNADNVLHNHQNYKFYVLPSDDKFASLKFWMHGFDPGQVSVTRLFQIKITILQHKKSHHKRLRITDQWVQGHSN